MNFAEQARDASPEPSGRAESCLPLKPDVFEILAALAGRDLHGYAILKEIGSRGIPLAASLLYRKLRRLLEDGLVAEIGEQLGEAVVEDPRRRMYRLTLLGREVVHAEARRIVALGASERVRRMAGLDLPVVAETELGRGA